MIFFLKMSNYKKVSLAKHQLQFLLDKGSLDAVINECPDLHHVMPRAVFEDFSDENTAAKLQTETSLVFRQIEMGC